MVIRIVDKNDNDVNNDYGDSNDAAQTWCSIDQKVIDEQEYGDDNIYIMMRCLSVTKNH